MQEIRPAPSVEEVALGEISRSAVDSSTPPDGAGEALEILVVEGAARSPVVRAEVFVVEASMPGPWRSYAAFLTDSELESLGRRSETDRDGRTNVAPPAGPAAVAARSAAGFAWTEIDPGQPGPVVLALEPDPPVAVRVVDPRGVPVAGASVALRCPLFAGVLVRATTGVDGNARLHPRAYRKLLLERGARVGLSAPMLLAERVEVPVDLELLPPQPILLVSPETGSVEVTVVDERGEPWRGEARVWMERSATAAGSTDWSPRAAQQEITDGHAFFEQVGLGLELRVGANPRERKESSVTVPGPTNPGQRVGVRLEVGGAVPVLVGRILDPARKPIAGAELKLDARFGNGGMGVACATDSGGRFRQAFDASGFEISEASDLRLVARRPGGEAYHGSIAQPRLRVGENDLGDVVLARSSVVASGIVVDEDGEPVRRASVSFLRDAIPGPGYWGTRLEEVLTDALGRFEWRAQVEVDAIGVRVSAQGLAGPDTQVVPVGTDGLLFVLTRGGWIAGRVLFTPQLWPSLEVWREGEQVIAPFSTGWTRDRGEFRLGPLPAGTYSLACGYPWTAERAWIDGIVVEAGLEGTDPRLDPLDLRAFLPTVALTILDREGRSVPDPVILLQDSRSGELVSAHPGRDGERWLVQGAPLPLRIRVEAAGFRAQELDGVDSDRTVVLQRGIPVRLELVGSLPELPEGWELRGQLMRQSFGAPAPGADRPTWLREQSFALTDGNAELWLAEPGGYLFAFLVTRENRTSRSTFWDEPQPALEIRDDGTLQAFELRAPSTETVQEIRAYVAEEE
jgi:hypothetical protein